MSARLVVDLTAFDRNVEVTRTRVAPAELMLVVKNDAYAHGLRPIVARATERGIRWFGAFDIPTGVRVREAAGAQARIFSWMFFGADQADAAVEAALDVGIGDADSLEEIAHAARRAGATARVHLKIDTGLHRNGVRPEEWEAFVSRAVTLAGEGVVDVVGIWSHIAEASDAEDDAARERYDAAVAQAVAAGVRDPLRHLAASAAAFQRPEFRYDITRVGAFCYGIRPAGGGPDAAWGISPIAELEADIVEASVEELRVDVGSADGIPSILIGALTVQSKAGPCRVRRIDATSMTLEPRAGVGVGDRVRIIGGGAASPTDLAETVDTIGEEIALRVSPLIERVYV